MRKLSPLILILALAACSPKIKVNPQEESNKNFAGAIASLTNYSAIYQLDTDDPKVVTKAFRNINNALTDPRLTGKLKIELITFSGGTNVMLKGSPYESQLKDLIAKGVLVVQCHNSLQERGLKKEQLYPFIGLVPSGNGELIIRNAQGWAIIKP